MKYICIWNISALCTPEKNKHGFKYLAWESVPNMEQTKTSIIHCNLESTGEVANHISRVEYGILINSNVPRTFTFCAI